jgi:hypothetical protein
MKAVCALIIICQHTSRASLKPIRPILSIAELGPVLELSTFCCSSTHNNTLQVLQRTILEPAFKYMYMCTYGHYLINVKLIYMVCVCLT